MKSLPPAPIGCFDDLNRDGGVNQADILIHAGFRPRGQTTVNSRYDR